jgi:ubiquinone/menaquinone biosynthesis C-methylase UbiE
VLSDGFHLPFKEKTFDGATLNWVLAHIPVVENTIFLREIKRVVKCNGWLFVSDSYWRGQEGGKEQVQIREVNGKEHEVYKYYYEPEELRQLLQRTFGEVELLLPLHYELICLAKNTT